MVETYIMLGATQEAVIGKVVQTEWHSDPRASPLPWGLSIVFHFESVLLRYSLHRIKCTHFKSVALSLGKCICLYNHHYCHPKRFPNVPFKSILTPSAALGHCWFSFYH